MSGGDVEIDKDVPPPERHPNLKYPWPDMEHGDSILAPWTKADKERITTTRSTETGASSAARSWVRRHRPGWMVATRSEGEATRIWFLDPSQGGVW